MPGGERREAGRGKAIYRARLAGSLLSVQRLVNKSVRMMDGWDEITRKSIVSRIYPGVQRRCPVTISRID